MAYRRTERLIERLAARREDILLAARELAAERGIAAVQIAPVAERVGIAAGTVYRYFPAKSDLVAALLQATAEAEIAAIRTAAASAPGALSALAAAIMTFAARTIGGPRLVAAALSEPIDAGLDSLRVAFRRTLMAEFEVHIRAAAAAGHLPLQDTGIAAAAVLGALVECAIGPFAQERPNPIDRKAAAQAAALLTLRALGIADARARGLIVQAPSSPQDGP